MRKLTPTNSFQRDIVKFLKKHKDLESNLGRVLRLLENDVYAAPLKTHKLHGKLRDSYACNIDYEYRITFSFDEKNVYLEQIGSHDDLY